MSSLNVPTPFTVGDRRSREGVEGRRLRALRLVDSHLPDLLLRIPDEGVIQGEQYSNRTDNYDVRDHRQYSYQPLPVLRLVELIFSLVPSETDLVRCRRLALALTQGATDARHHVMDAHFL